MGLNRNINDDSTLAYLFNKTRQGASDALQKAIDAINATIASIQTALNNKVSKSGDTMSGNLSIAKNDPRLILKSSVMDTSANPPSGASSVTVSHFDKNDAYASYWQTTELADGTVITALAARRIVNSQNHTNGISLSVTPAAALNVSVSSPTGWRTAIGAVNKAGDTMTGNLDIALSGTPHFYLINNLANTTLATDTATRQWSIYHKDKNGKVLSYWESTFGTDGTAGTNLRVRRPVNGTDVNNGVNFSVTANGTRTVSVSAPDAWRSALGLESVTIVSTASQIITVASGFTITTASLYTFGKVAQIRIGVKKTTAQTTVTSMTIGTIVAGKRPINNIGLLSGNIMIDMVFLSSNGTLTAHGTWTAGTTIEFDGIYLLA